MMKVEDSCGLAQLKASRESLLNQPSPHHNLLSRNNHPLRAHLAFLPLLLPPRKDGSSRSCSVIWWTPRNSLPSSIPKSIEKSSVCIKLLVRKSSSVLT